MGDVERQVTICAQLLVMAGTKGDHLRLISPENNPPWVALTVLIRLTSEGLEGGIVDGTGGHAARQRNKVAPPESPKTLENGEEEENGLPLCK